MPPPGSGSSPATPSTWRPASRRPPRRARSCSAPTPTPSSAPAVDAVAIEPLALKGKSEPVPAWRLTEVTDAGRQARPASDAPLVGRRRPLRSLMTRSTRRSRSGSATSSRSSARPAWESRAWSRSSSARWATRPRWPRAGAWRTVRGSPTGRWPRPSGRAGDRGGRATRTGHRVACGRCSAQSRRPNGLPAIVGGLLGIEDSRPAPEEIFRAIRKTFEALARRRPSSSSSTTSTGGSRRSWT